MNPSNLYPPQPASALSEALRKPNSNPMRESIVETIPVHHRLSIEGAAPLPSISHSCRFGKPSSLPHPRAPFLSSQQGPKDKLSSMPVVKLPESVTSINTKSPSSSQYGSLRESRFTHLQHDHILGRTSLSNSSSFGPCTRNSPVLHDTEASLNSKMNIRTDPSCQYRNELLCELPPLSSSLTALDVMTRISETTFIGMTSKDLAAKASPPLPQSCLQQNPANLVSKNQLGVILSYDNDEINGNPDTFEAFDFELDEE